MAVDFLLDFALTESHDDDQRKAAALVFVATSLEILLEEAVWSVLDSGQTRSALGQWTVSRCRGVDNRLKFMKEVAGIDLKSVAEESGCPECMQDWKRLRDMRNEVVHSGNIFTLPPDLQTWLQSIASLGIVIFADVNNRIWPVPGDVKR